MFRNLLTKPQGETRNMFLLELTYTELKTDSEEAAAMNFAQEQQSAITGHSLSFCLFPTASRLQELLSSPAFSCCSWPKALPESCAELGNVVSLRFPKQGSQHRLTQLKTWHCWEGGWTKMMGLKASTHLVVWSRMHNQASPSAAPMTFLSMVFNWG